MDTLGALALATEPPTDELMKRLPVGRGESFITKAMWRNIIGQSIYQLAVLAVLNFDGKNLLRLNGPDATTVLNTLIFNSFVFCQVQHVIDLLNDYSLVFDIRLSLYCIILPHACLCVFLIVSLLVLSGF